MLLLLSGGLADLLSSCFFLQESHYYPALRILIMYAVYRPNDALMSKSLAKAFSSDLQRGGVAYDGAVGHCWCPLMHAK